MLDFEPPIAATLLLLLAFFVSNHALTPHRSLLAQLFPLHLLGDTRRKYTYNKKTPYELLFELLKYFKENNSLFCVKVRPKEDVFKGSSKKTFYSMFRKIGNEANLYSHTIAHRTYEEIRDFFKQHPELLTRLIYAYPVRIHEYKKDKKGKIILANQNDDYLGTKLYNQLGPLARENSKIDIQNGMKQSKYDEHISKIYENVRHNNMNSSITLSA